MQIGFVRQNARKVKENGEQKEVKYLEMFLRPMFGMVQGFTLSKSTSDAENAPAYNIYAHNTQGWIGRKAKVGALWMRETEEGDKFMSGNIETPLVANGRMSISVWKAKPLFEGENVDWAYDVSWNPYDDKKDDTSVPRVPNATTPSHSSDDDDEMPF
jgi:uncharacterized protein (DUF736 family)